MVERLSGYRPVGSQPTPFPGDTGGGTGDSKWVHMEINRLFTDNDFARYTNETGS